MSLVYNLVTQQDAANNIQIAIGMKHDSTSMNSIAALTMAFLPGTFTASILGAGIFSAIAGGQNVRVSSLWWLWVVITIPLTIVVVICWWWYGKRKTALERIAKYSGTAEAASIPEQRTFSTGAV
ncbi:MAG: hypothetical protein M1833_006653 [Piccolia ochrophora]|nr:MAG: hypothetical protein M1833_006653 [Piccolia ochrophora]